MGKPSPPGRRSGAYSGLGDGIHWFGGAVKVPKSALMKTAGIASLAAAAVSCYYVEALCPLAMGAAVAVFAKGYQSHGKLPPPGPGLPPVAPGAHVMPLSQPNATSIYYDTNNNAYFNPATKTFYNPTYQLYYDPSTNTYTDRQGNVVPAPGAAPSAT